MQDSLSSELQTLRDVEVEMLRNWMNAQEKIAESLAANHEVRQLILKLVAPADGKGEDLQPLEIGDSLYKIIKPVMNAHDYDHFVLTNRERVIASSRVEAVGLEIPSQLRRLIDRVYERKALVSRPFKSLLSHVDQNGTLQAGVPMMFVLAPVLDEQLQVVTTLGLQIRPEVEFTRLLQLGQLGESGETYAFDAEGLMLSNSRFDDDLRLDGLLQEGDDSILELLVRDPGGNIPAGHRPDKLRSQLPPTHMVASAVAGQSGINVTGYRDYRGVPVVGAWTWLEDYGFGVATEMDYREAYRPLTILKRTFWGVFSLLVASSIAIFIFTLLMARSQRQAREAEIEAKQLGQYKLEAKLGAGAMGVVYRGQHAMLRRPTAVKLLEVDRVTDASIERFEREVQITSQLNHPNTIAIYDYGRTPEGVFYYAMEYLDGINLQELVETYGPQPAGRVSFILNQICGSLYEAHCSGLVHRDIKPANVMINRRGGEGDVVKVLDFGLVKARGDVDDDLMAGTPLYMSPEAIHHPGSVDACSDLYSVGAVGYFLLTGHSVFEATDLADLCQKQESDPISPSERLGSPIPAELEHAILACLEKSRAKRPQTARELAKMLADASSEVDWSLDRADTWWSAHERRKKPSTGSDTRIDAVDATILFES